MIMDVVRFVTKHKVTRDIAERIVRGFTEVVGTEVAPEVQEKRLDTCSKCDVFTPTTRLCDSEKGGCGCFVDIKAKYSEIDFVTFKETIKCPLGKW